MQKKGMDKIRKHLEAEEKRLLGRIEVDLTLGSDAGNVQDAGDIASEYTGKMVGIGVQETETGLLKSIRKALERLDDGSYGLCASCGKKIGKERLEVVPTAEKCITCANQ